MSEPTFTPKTDSLRHLYRGERRQGIRGAHQIGVHAPVLFRPHRRDRAEAHQWDVPDEILAGGRMGWPLILSSLKSFLETGKAIAVKLG